MTRRAHHSLAIVAAIALVAVGCTSTPPIPSSPAAPIDGSQGAPSPSTSSDGETALIPQPAAPEGVVVASDDLRVDLEVPGFSDPSEITNPLFPISSQHSVLLLGTVEDQPFRTEVTLLPHTRVLQWEGRQIEVAVSQYVAFLGGRIQEVAYDLYAQADDGSVWYFGEDVYNFADGVITDTHGTWIAGIDGPPAMIMPADPQVGDVYRTENIPGLVFEEVTVHAVGETFDGPLGAVEGGIVVEELHMDATTEEKQYAPGYGEFYTAADNEVEALAMAIPTDTSENPEPEPLAVLIDEPRALLAALDEGDADAVTASVERIIVAHDDFPAVEIPARVGPVLDETVRRLSAAAADGDDAATGQAAIDLGRLGLDLGLRWRDQLGIEIGRYDLWLAQMQLDAAAEETALLHGDYFALDYVRERFVSALDPEQAGSLNLGMEELISAIDEEDFGAVAEIATHVRSAAAEISPTE